MVLDIIDENVDDNNYVIDTTGAQILKEKITGSIDGVDYEIYNNDNDVYINVFDKEVMMVRNDYIEVADKEEVEKC